MGCEQTMDKQLRHLSAIIKLIKAGADPTIETDDGKTVASHYAGLEWPGKNLTPDLELAMNSVDFHL